MYFLVMLSKICAVSWGIKLATLMDILMVQGLMILIKGKAICGSLDVVISKGVYCLSIMRQSLSELS